MTDTLTAADLDAIEALYHEALEKGKTAYLAPVEWHQVNDWFIDNVLALLALARDGIEAEKKLRILYDIGITPEDEAELHRRLQRDETTAEEGAGDE